MLPGLGLGPVALEPLPERIKVAGFRVVLPEPRGYGDSIAPRKGVTLRDLAEDVARVIESIGGAPVVLAGQTYGNRVARMVATDHPELVRAVVLLAAVGKYPGHPQAAQNLATWLNEALPAEQRAAAAKAFLFGPQSDPSPADLMLDVLSAETAKMQQAAVDPKRFPLESWWPGGNARMLVIQGLADVIAPPENGRSLKADFPDRVTLVELDGLGHLVSPERPDLVADAIIGFVRGRISDDFGWGYRLRALDLIFPVQR
jgi:pimeloyl-ACP methyl ester carboxylesterase